MEEETQNQRHIPGLAEPKTKSKKGKKKTNSKKTLTLQNFLQEPNQQENGDGGGSTALTNNQHINSRNTLDEKEAAILESCNSYICDYLKQRGPTNALDPALQTEFQNFPTEAKQLMTKVGGYKAFILLCKDLVVVDKVVAAKCQLPQAQQLVFKEIYSNIPNGPAAAGAQPTRVTPNCEQKQIWNSSISPNSKGTIWTPTSENSQPGTGGTIQYHPTQTNQTEDGDFCGRGVIGNSHKQNGIFLSGAKLGADTTNNEELQEKIWTLTTYNNQLIKQLNQKESQLAELPGLYARLAKLEREAEAHRQLNQKDSQLAELHGLKARKASLERENEARRLLINEQREEIDRLRQELSAVRNTVGDSRAACNSVGPLQTDRRQDVQASDSQRDLMLSMSLQSPLEAEKLENRNLTHQQKESDTQLPGLSLHAADQQRSLAGSVTPIGLAPGSGMTVPVATTGLLPSINPNMVRATSYGGLGLTGGLAASNCLIGGSSSVDSDPLGLRSLSIHPSIPSPATTSLASSGCGDIKSGGQSMYGAIGSDLNKQRSGGANNANSVNLNLMKSASASSLGFPAGLGMPMTLADYSSLAPGSIQSLTNAPATQPPTGGNVLAAVTEGNINNIQALPVPQPGFNSHLPSHNQILQQQQQQQQLHSHNQMMLPGHGLPHQPSLAAAQQLIGPGLAQLATSQQHVHQQQAVSNGMPSSSRAQQVGPTAATTTGDNCIQQPGTGTQQPPNIVAATAQQAAHSQQQQQVLQQQQETGNGGVGSGSRSGSSSGPSTPVPPGGKSNSAIRQEQLVKKLVAAIPNSTEDEVKHYIQVLREKHGKLSGRTFSRIAGGIIQLMKEG